MRSTWSARPPVCGACGLTVLRDGTGGRPGAAGLPQRRCRVDTTLYAEALLTVAQQCESVAGRERGERWGPRTLDVDVLAYGDVESDDPTLTLPHPRALERAFVLVPWAAVDPDFVVRRATVRQWADQIDAIGVLPSAELDEPR